jgi:hypothetical protein
MYYVFGGLVHYPSGGADDFIDSHENLEEAVEIALVFLGDEQERYNKWAHVYVADDVQGLVKEWEYN